MLGSLAHGSGGSSSDERVTLLRAPSGAARSAEGRLDRLLSQVRDCDVRRAALSSASTSVLCGVQASTLPADDGRSSPGSRNSSRGAPTSPASRSGVRYPEIAEEGADAAINSFVLPEAQPAAG